MKSLLNGSEDWEELGKVREVVWEMNTFNPGGLRFLLFTIPVG